MAYQTSHDDAAALVANWLKYAATPGKKFQQKDIDYWIEQVQKNGSAAAWGQFEKQNPGATDRINVANAGTQGGQPVAYGMTLGDDALAGQTASGFDKFLVNDVAPLIQPAATGILTYGASKLLPTLGDAAERIPGVGPIVEQGRDAAQNAGEWWDRTVAQPVQDATQGIHLPNLPGTGPIPNSSGGSGGGGFDWLGAAGLANAAYLGQKASNFADLAKDNADRAYKEKAPIREMGLAGMQAAPIKLPELGAIRSRGNPFAGA